MRCFSFILIATLVFSLASCRADGIANSSLKPTPPLEIVPSDNIDTKIPSASETAGEAIILRDLVDSDAVECNLLHDLENQDENIRYQNILNVIDGMIDGSIYHDDGTGIKFKSGAKINCNVFWAGFHYDGDKRYVTGNKYTLDAYYNNMRYLGYYITPNRNNNVDFNQIESTYIEASFKPEGFGYYSNRYDADIINNPHQELLNLKRVVLENKASVGRLGDAFSISFTPTDNINYEEVTVVEDKIYYGRFNTYSLDINSKLKDIRDSIDKIEFHKSNSDSYLENNDNPLYNDSRAKNALIDKLTNKASS